MDIGEFNGRRLYTALRLDYRLRLWSPTSALCTISAVADLVVMLVIILLVVVVVGVIIAGVVVVVAPCPLPSVTQHPSYDDCLEVKKDDYQNCSVLYCVTQLYRIISTLI